MDFEIVGEIAQIETIASGSGVRDRARLRKQYGQGRWRKLKGVARVRLVDAAVRLAKIHMKRMGSAKESSNSSSHSWIDHEESQRRDTSICLMPQ